MSGKILATKSGWLIAVEVLRETRKAFVVRERDSGRERRVEKDSSHQALFDDCDQAMAWQGVPSD